MHYQGEAHFFFCLFGIIGLSHALPLIVIGPMNQTVGIEDTARFRCSIDVPSSISAFSVKWFRENAIISDNREVYTELVEGGRYAIIGDTENDYDLQITEVLPIDEAKFKCQVEVDSSQTETSDPVFLTVHYPPDVKRFRCQPSIKPIIVEIGELIELNCNTETAVPTPSLSWMTEDGQNITDAWRDPRFGRLTEVLRYEKNVTIEDNGKSFICILSHPLLLEDAECRVGPYDVLHAPVNATITPQNATFIEGNDVKLECTADANPADDIKITWASDPQFMGSNITSKKAIYFNNAPLRLNGTTLTCNATSSRGHSSAMIVVEIIPRVTQPPKVQPTKGANKGAVPTEQPGDNQVDTYLIAFILIGVIFVLLLVVVVILVIGRKWREPVIILDVNDEVCRRSLSGGGSLVLGSNSHIVVHQTPTSERHLFQIHQGRKDKYSITSVEAAGSHAAEHYPSDPQKAAKIEGTEFYRSAHSSRRNSVESDCSGSHYERSICSDSRPSTPTRSHDPLPPTPHESFQMNTLCENSGDKIVALEDTEHHADKNYYMNTQTKKPKENATSNGEKSVKRDSGEHNYEDLTPESKRKLYDKEIDTGEEDFPEDDRPRVTPEQQLGEVKDDLLIKM